MFLVPNVKNMTYKFFLNYQDAKKYKDEMDSLNTGYKIEIVELKDGKSPSLWQDGAWEM